MNKLDFKILNSKFLTRKMHYIIKNKYIPKQTKEKYIKQIESLIIEGINSNVKIDNIINWFEIYLKNYYYEDFYLLENHKLIKLIKENYDEAKYQKFKDYLIMDFIKFKQTDEYNNKISEYIGYKDKKDITNDQFERYIYALINTNSNDYDFAFKMLFDNKYYINDKLYKQLFYKVGLFFMKEFKLCNSGIVYESGMEYLGRYSYCKFIDDPQHDIHLKKECIKLPSKISNIVTLFHEITHGVQVIELSELYDFNAFKRIEDIVLSNKYMDYYNNNYKQISIETDAKKCSYILLEHFLERYAPISYQKCKEEIKNKKENVFETDIRLYNSEMVNVHILFSNILKNDLNALNYLSEKEKKVVFQIYNEDGTYKTSREFFEKKELLLNEIRYLNISSEKREQNLKKIKFYDDLLYNICYDSNDLKRNVESLDGFFSSNPDLNEEIRNYQDGLISLINTK